jgi:nucleoside-diphosphate-sugar epimerase
MKIAITGALGHIGSRLIREIPDRFPEAEILMVDNLSTQRYASLFNLPGRPRYRFWQADVLTADLESIFDDAEMVVHLAAITDAPSSFEMREQVERVNLEGTKRVALACLRSGSALIFPSTTSVYGSQAKTVDEALPQSDLRPQSPYADSKLRAERWLEAVGAGEGVRFITCRFGTIFGTSPGMRFHTAINKFCWQAAVGQPLTIWRTALHQERPYLDLDDAIRAIFFIIERKLYDGRVYNVVTTNSSISRIVEMISCHVPDVSTQYVDVKVMNQLSYRVSSDRFQSLGFEFRGDLERGIKETLELLRGIRQW